MSNKKRILDALTALEGAIDGHYLKLADTADKIKDDRRAIALLTALETRNIKDRDAVDTVRQLVEIHMADD